MIPYNNYYTKSYLKLIELISNEYQVKGINHIPKLIFCDKLDSYGLIKKSWENPVFHTDTIYRAIMDNDKERFISFTEREGFDEDQSLTSKLFPQSNYTELSLLELCCYYGAVDCFKLLRTKFKSEITRRCLEFSFLGRNQEILSECLKYQNPSLTCKFYAIISHNIDIVTFLMNEYEKCINLHFCMQYNNLESFFVDFDQTNNSNSCFINSAIFDIPSICEYFLSNGANVNAESLFGALCIAVDNNCKNVAEFLISRGANVNQKDGAHGITALHIAAENNSKETAEVLISHGANINQKDDNGKSALHIAAKNNCKETAELLLVHGANVNEKDKYGETALHHAIGRSETIELLLVHGANVNEKDNNGRTALLKAAGRNKKKIVELLLLHGANINEKDEEGNTVLHEAAAGLGSKEIIEFLLVHGANVNERNEEGRTVLHLAARFDYKELAELLILHGANINEKDKNGKTALHEAANITRNKTDELLISYGASY
ncbi:ankyrin repeat protein, putative [Trichomonas vaginalis G3]|uniref:Ankyrin repeat protein, putative n=1 Tax=Trichomonas vaginalis (strain ATCC PRA-98 / G3) TaxID=412133 RepID=A2EEQ7_TRIV3|nr:ankyrin repeat and SOCS box-containing protein 4 family [Trichomonas vaginalis G3]EAY08863.1 ankyrin repeat protein, putative [Trichomonas vaginalis G3]KAI5489358.1 ankyrin repeat and SOCS box-containing protein 4 family [Trichomonas vaginalis G3]|eukprot:XP_001321086.1 ankyrin repeat protein [Trichomonas vaginalis G3]